MEHGPEIFQLKAEVKEEHEDMPSAHSLENIPGISGIKIEPEWSQIQIESFSGGHLERQETTLNVDKNIECHSNQILDTVSDMPQRFAPEQIDESLKIEIDETTLKSESMQEIDLVECNIKDEEIDEEINDNGSHFKHNQIMSSSGDYSDGCEFEENSKNKNPQYKNCEDVKVGTFNLGPGDNQTFQKKVDDSDKFISLPKSRLRQHNRLTQLNSIKGNGKLLKCNLCDYRTVYKSNLKFHLLRHKNIDEVNDSYKFKCDQCAYVTISKRDLKGHILIRHKNRDEIDTFKCIQCDFRTAYKKNLERHLLRHKNIEEVDDSNKFKCGECSHIVLRKSDLKSHILLRHKNIDEIDASRKFQCDQCAYVTLIRRNFQRHILLRHKTTDEIEIFKCIHCEFQTVYKKSMEIHILRHKSIDEVDDSNKFKCDQCTYVTLIRSHLQRHILRRHKNTDEIEIFKCIHCEFQTVYKKSMERHILRHKSIDEVDDSNKFKCDQCAYVTIIHYNLKKHILLRHKNIDEIETFKCIQCNFRTVSKRSMDTHLLRHKNIDEVDDSNKFMCNQCAYVTLRKCHLKTHIYLRHKNRDDIDASCKFNCDQCAYVTLRRSDLRKHELCHKNIDDIETFNCNQCDYRARRRPNLTRHLLKHKIS